MKFSDVVTEAVSDITEHGFDPERIAFWQEKLRKAAADAMGSTSRVDDMLREALRDVYRKMIERGQAVKFHPGVSRFTIDRLKPKMRVEMERRIFVAADLIKLNRSRMLTETLQRFSGWASSIQPGGSDVVDKREVKANIGKAISQRSFSDRRTIIDQGSKFAANLNDIIATDGGAIAAIWQHHHVTYPRKEHLERNGHILLIRGSWAHDGGLVRPSGHLYTDEIEQVAEFPFCHCTYRYLYALRDIPDEMLTAKGRDELARVRAQIAGLRKAA